MIIEWARARGDDAEIVWRAQQVMLLSGGPHDAHIHVRTACTRDEATFGCINNGPDRPWLHEPPRPIDGSELNASAPNERFNDGVVKMRDYVELSFHERATPGRRGA